MSMAGLIRCLRLSKIMVHGFREHQSIIYLNQIVNSSGSKFRRGKKCQESKSARVQKCQSPKVPESKSATVKRARVKKCQ